MDLPAFYHNWSTQEVALDSSHRKVTALWKAHEMLSILPPSFQPTSLLEIGCAEGFILNEFEKQFKTNNGLGVDLATPFIDKAKKLHPHLKFLQGDVTTMHFDQKFGLVIIADVLEHLEFPEKFMRSLAGVAKYIVIKMPLEKSFFDNVIMRSVGKKTYPGTNHHEGHLWECTYQEFLKFFSNYVDIESKKLLLPPIELEYPQEDDKKKMLIRLKILGNKIFPITLATNLFGGHCVVFGEIT
jgi:trans-aconitate methyltransferase